MLNGRFSFGDVTGDVTNRRPVGLFQRFESNLVLLRGAGFLGFLVGEICQCAVGIVFPVVCVFAFVFCFKYRWFRGLSYGQLRCWEGG